MKKILLIFVLILCLPLVFLLAGCEDSLIFPELTTTTTTSSSTTTTSTTSTTLISAPSNLSASATSLQATLSWEAVAGASYYNLYWSNTSGVTKAGILRASSVGTRVAGVSSPYTHTGLTNGQAYYYVVTAVGSQSGESVESNQAVATPETVGTLDASFNGDGIAVYGNAAGGGNVADYGNSIITDSAGRILVAGYSSNSSDEDMVIWRYNADGSLDTSFDSDGIVVYDGGNDDDSGDGITLDSSGKILVTGNSRNASGDQDMIIWRYNTDGSLDTSFDSDGIVTHESAAGGNGNDYGRAITTDSTGRILAAGSSWSGSDFDLVIWRYNTDGSLDTSFDSDGIAVYDGGNGDGRAITTDSAGRILVVGSSNNGTDDDLAVWRYNSDGSLDTSFDGDGIATYDGGNGGDYGFGIATDSAGRILAAGYERSADGFRDWVILRYNTDGSLDTSFNSNGIAVQNNVAGGNGDDRAYGITTDSAGRILVTGYSYNGSNLDMAVLRYNTDGSLDTSFNSDGIVISNGAAGGTGSDMGFDILIDSSGRILVTGISNNAWGDADMAIWRYK